MQVFGDSVMLCGMITGYGDVAPETTWTKLFGIFFIVSGLTTAAVGVSILVKSFVDSLNTVLDRNEGTNYPVIASFRKAMFSTVLWATVMLVGALVFWQVESGWTFVDGLWYVVEVQRLAAHKDELNNAGMLLSRAPQLATVI